MSAYYPVHFQQTRPYLKDFQGKVATLDSIKQLNFKSSFDAAGKSIMALIPRNLVNPDHADYNPRAFSSEIQAALVYGEWSMNGMPLYEFDPVLTEALKASAVGDIAISDLKFPFNAAYMHFGEQPDLTLQTGACITGAYIIYSAPHSLRIALTAPMPAGTLWFERYKELYDLRIPADYFGMDVESAIDHALAEDIAGLKKALEQTPNHPGFQAGGRASVEQFLQAHEAHRETYRKCVQLIINGLCYLTAYSSDVREVWQAGTPDKMRIKAEAGAPKEAERARSKLNALGYRKVRYIGQEFHDALETVPEGHMAPHWRRGHWRNQAHGVQMSQRRLTWIKPTRVLGAVTNDEPRVYEVRNEGSAE